MQCSLLTIYARGGCVSTSMLHHVDFVLFSDTDLTYYVIQFVRLRHLIGMMYHLYSLYDYHYGLLNCVYLLGVSNEPQCLLSIIISFRFIIMLAGADFELLMSVFECS